MKTKRSNSGYGVFDLSRQVARRIQREWEMVESPRRSLEIDTTVIQFAPPPPPIVPLPPREKRPLAA